MADRIAPPAGSVEEHPDFPHVFAAARDEVWGEFLPRYERAVQSGNIGAAERIQARVDERARQRAAAATQALRQFDAGDSPMLARFERDNPHLRVGAAPGPVASVPTLTGREAEPAAPIPSLVPPLPRPIDAVPEGQGLQPQTPEEAEQLRRDHESFVDTAIMAGTYPLGGAVARGVVGAGRMLARPAAAVGRGIASHPGTASTVAATTALVAAPARTQTPRPAETAQRALDTAQREFETLSASRQQLLDRQRALQQEAQRFDNITTTDRNAVRQAQEYLATQGLYGRRADGTIVRPDGIWADGTRQAIEAFRNRTATDLQAIGTQLDALNTRVDAARTALDTAQTTHRQATGGERLREIDENTSWMESAARTFGPWAGAVLGGLFGYGVRTGVAKGMGEIARRRAARADDLMDQSGRGSVPQRVGNLQQFWSEGSRRRGGTPFLDDATRTPHPYRVNPNAVPAEELYRPGALSRFGPDTALLGLAGAEFGYVHSNILGPAREEMEAARAAVSADANEVNIQRYNRARDELAKAETLDFFTRGQLGGTAAGTLKGQLRYAPPRPAVGVADAERGRLTSILQRQEASPAPTASPAPIAPGSTPPPGSLWNESAQRWMGPAEPGRPGRPFLSGNYAPPRRRK